MIKLETIHSNFLKVHKYYLISVCCLFVSLSVTFKDSYNATALLILISYIGFISPNIRKSIKLNRYEKLLVTASIIYFFAFILELLIYDTNIKILEEPAKILIFVPLIFLLNAVNFNKTHLAHAFIISSLLLFSYACYDLFIKNEFRAGSLINPIQFGTISIAIASAALAFIPIFSNKGYKRSTIVILAAVAFSGIAAGLMSQSRGSIIALPITITIILLLYYYHLKLNKKIFLSSILAFFIIGLTLLSSQEQTMSRFTMAIGNAQAYITGEGTKSSTGIRLGLWSAAVESGMKAPIIGVGHEELVRYKNSQVEKGKLGEELLEFDNTHSTYLNAFARRGLIGLSAVILFLGLPIYIGFTIWRLKEKSLAPYSVALITFGTTFFISNITQEVIYLSTGAIMYTGLLIILVSMMSKALAEVNESKLTR